MPCRAARERNDCPVFRVGGVPCWRRRKEAEAARREGEVGALMVVLISGVVFGGGGWVMGWIFPNFSILDFSRDFGDGAAIVFKVSSWTK